MNRSGKKQGDKHKGVDWGNIVIAKGRVGNQEKWPQIEER